MNPTPVSIERATLEAEKADYEKQFAEAQNQVHIWTQKGLVASGALQAVNALLGKLDTPVELVAE